MVDDKLFHALVSRLASRESTSMTFSAISSSASLVLLALSSSPSSVYEIESFLIPIFGFLFTAIGFIYFELTYRTIHNHDHKSINELIKNEYKDSTEEKKKEVWDKIIYNNRRKERIFLSRLLLLFPIIAWSIVTPIRLDLECSLCLQIIGIIGTLFTVVILTLTDKPLKL